LWHLVSGKKLTWDKTMHAYPSMAELGQAEGGRLGEALIYWGAIDESTLKRALALQADEYRPLGLLLLDLGEIDEDQFADGVAEHKGWDRIDLDPFKTPDDLRDLVSPEIAAKYAVFPVSREGRRLVLAAGEPLNAQEISELRRDVRRPIKLVSAPLSDVGFGLRFAYGDPEGVATDRRAARVLRRVGLLDQTQIASVWRSLHRDVIRLGDLLVRSGAISHEQLMRFQRGFDSPDESLLADELVKSGLVRRSEIDAALAAQPKPPFGFVMRAKSMGYLSETDWNELQEAHADLVKEDA
jgi:adsorption protein B